MISRERLEFDDKPPKAEGAITVSETLQRYSYGHAPYTGMIGPKEDGEYVLHADAQRRIEELEGVLKEWMEFHPFMAIPDADSPTGFRAQIPCECSLCVRTRATLRK